METPAPINKLTKALIVVVIITYLLFFLLEAVLWMQPFVNTLLLQLLNNPVTLAYALQALMLKNLFINQGCYNLLLAIGGVYGLYLISKKSYIAGYILVQFICFCAIGAGIVLACSTKAYLFAFLQAAPALTALLRIYPAYKATTGVRKV